MNGFVALLKMICDVLVKLSPALMAFLAGKQQAELEHERETKESLANTVERLANRPVDRDDLAARLRTEATDQRNKPN